MLSGLFLTVALSYLLYSGLVRWAALRNSRYTVATTIETYFSKSGRMIKYSYEVNGVTYQGTDVYLYHSKVPDGRYLCKFSLTKPEYSELYQDRPVPAELTVVPENGWKIPPW